MTLYSVYEPPSEAQDLEDRAESLVFVKEGFSWPALFVPASGSSITACGSSLSCSSGCCWCSPGVFGPSDAGKTVFGWISLALVVLFAFEANDLRGAALERRGYKQMRHRDRRRPR